MLLFFTRTTSQSLCLHKTLATVAITIRNRRHVSYGLCSIYRKEYWDGRRNKDVEPLPFVADWILILDLIAFTLLAVAYFWNGDIGDQEIKYEDAELVFDDLSGQKVIPSGEPVGIYLKTDGVMVVDCDEVETAQGEICSPCNGLLQTGDYITAVNETAISTKRN